MIEILPPLGKYKYDTWRILPVKCYIDNFVRLRSCIRNVNKLFWRRCLGGSQYLLSIYRLHVIILAYRLIYCPMFVYGLHRELHEWI
jgi:hypothetical protein